MCIGVPFPLELELQEFASRLVQVLGTEPGPLWALSCVCRPPDVAFLEQSMLLVPCYPTSCSGLCHTGNTCSLVPTGWVFSEGGKTWCIWTPPGLLVLPVQQLLSGSHLASSLALSQTHPPHSHCGHCNSLSWMEPCTVSWFCQTSHSHPSWLAPPRRMMAEKALYCCLEMLVLESGVGSERDTLKDIRGWQPTSTFETVTLLWTC